MLHASKTVPQEKLYFYVFLNVVLDLGYHDDSGPLLEICGGKKISLDHVFLLTLYFNHVSTIPPAESVWEQDVEVNNSA